MPEGLRPNLALLQTDALRQGVQELPGVLPLFYMYDYGSHQWGEMGPIARLWMRIGPYLVLLVLPLLARGTAGEIWFWSAFVIVLGAEAIAYLIGWWVQRSNRSEVEIARGYIESASDTGQVGE